MKKQENIYAFYIGKEKDLYGRYFDEIIKKDKYWLELEHNYIQRLFPLNETSKYDKTAPILSKEITEKMKNDVIIKVNMKKALQCMLEFYSINEYPQNIKWHYWITPYNHNYKRLTRMMKSLLLMDLEKEANDLYDYLFLLYKKYPYLIGRKTIKYWTNAITKH